MSTTMSKNIIFITPHRHTEYWDLVSRGLWEENFDDSEEYCDFYFNRRWKVSSAFFIGGFSYNGQGTLTRQDCEIGSAVSMMHLCPYTLFFCGKEPVVNYLVGVCTVLNERRKGHMARLLEECFKELYINNAPFLYLMPADTKIYIPFGFRSFYEVSEYRGSFEEALKFYSDGINIKAKAVIGGQSTQKNIKVKEYGRLSESEMFLICDFACRKLKSKANCFVKRDAEYFELRADEMKSCKGGLFTFWKMGEKDMPVGYVMLMMEDGVEISEFLVEDGYESYVLNALGDELKWERHSEIFVYDTMFLDKLSGENKKKLMGRIICLEKFVELFSKWSEADKIFNSIKKLVSEDDEKNYGVINKNNEIFLDISDNFIIQNTGFWKISLEKNKIDIYKIVEGDIAYTNMFTKITIEQLFECMMSNCIFYMNEMV